MQTKPKVSLTKTVLFTVCSILVLDSFVAPAIIGVSSITVWLLTALLFFVPYGLISAELGSTFADDGGIVSWVRRAFGAFPSTLVAWMYWINVALWMPAVFVAFTGWLTLALFPGMSTFAQAGLAIAMCWVIVFIGVRGIDLSVTVSGIMGIMKMSVLLLFGILGVIYGITNGLNNDFSLLNWIPSWDSAATYIGAIVFNFLGLELIGSIGSKIDNAKKTIPRMILIAGAIITFLYAFGTFGILSAIPADRVDTVDGFVYALLELCSVFGAAQRPVFTGMIVIAILTLIANMISWSMGANESFMAAGLDRKVRFFAHRHPRYGTADHLYYTMGGISSMLILFNFLLSGDVNDMFWTLFGFGSVVLMMNYLFMFPAALKLRYTDATPRQYAVPGGKAGLWLCTLLSFGFVVFACYFLINWDVTGYAFWMQVVGVAAVVFTGWRIHRAGE